jgi:hypothetical protein
LDLHALIPERSLADDIFETRTWMDREIAACFNDRHRQILTNYRDHWWGEAIGDLDMVMRTMAPDPMYRGFGSDKFGELVIDTTEGARELYANLFAAGFYPAGAFTERRYSVADWGMVIEAVNTAIVPGAFFAGLDLEPGAGYLASWKLLGFHPYDQYGLMQAEILRVEDPTHVEYVRGPAS